MHYLRLTLAAALCVLLAIPTSARPKARGRITGTATDTRLTYHTADIERSIPVTRGHFRIRQGTAHTSRAAYCMFESRDGLTSATFRRWDFSRVTDASYMLYNCRFLRSADLTGCKFTKAETAAGMFEDCHALRSVNLSGCDLSAVRDASCMFADCTTLRDLDISGCDLSHVADATYMFFNCNPSHITGRARCSQAVYDAAPPMVQAHLDVVKQ